MSNNYPSPPPSGWVFNLTLTQTTTPNVADPQGVPAHYMEIVAAAPNGGDPAIFVYQLEVTDPTNQTLGAYFRNVVSLPDYQEIPLEPTDPDSSHLLFRTPKIQAFFPTYQAMQDFWADIQSDTQGFLTAMKQAWTLYPSNTQTVQL